MTKLTDLTATVALMRKLGVVSFDGIVLGPEPAPRPAPVKKRRPKDDGETTRSRAKRSFYEDLFMKKLTPDELEKLPEP